MPLGWAGIRRCSRKTVQPRLDAAGKPVNRTVLFPKAKADILDTWHVSGLRATASNDYQVSGLFVPAAYSTWRDSAPTVASTDRSTTSRC